MMRGRKAVAALEFGLLAPAWLICIFVLADFAAAFYLKIRLAAGLSAASYYAFVEGQSVTANTVGEFLANLQTVTQSGSGLAATMQVTAHFNNAADASNAANYYCVSGTGGTSWASTGTATASCGSSLTSGKFVTISATASMPSLFTADPILGPILSASDFVLVRIR